MIYALFAIHYGEDHYLMLEVDCAYSKEDIDRARIVIDEATKKLGEIDFDKLRDDLEQENCDLEFIGNDFAPAAYSSQGEWLARRLLYFDYGVIFFRERNGLWHEYVKDPSCSDMSAI